MSIPFSRWWLLTRHASRNERVETDEKKVSMKLFRQASLSLSEQAHKSKGQAIVLIAFVFIGLIAFTGLVVDVASVLTRYSQLRRALDAAGIQAANQFRESRDLYNAAGGDLFSAVQQIMAVQGFSQPETRIRIFACNNPGASILTSRDNSSPGPPADAEYDEGALEAQLCMTPPRKLVRVDAQSDVGLPFLSVIGWRFVTLKVTSVGEAASIDVALVLDRSGSMARESGGLAASGCAEHTPPDCAPFEDVRNNAILLVQRLRFPYDHVAIIQFDRVASVFDTAGCGGTGCFVANPGTISSTMMINNRAVAEAALNTDNFKIMSLAESYDIPGTEPHIFNSRGLNTNIGGAIKTATRVLTVQGRRRASVWMTLFLTDGAPNATDPFTGFPAGFCPPTAWPSRVAMTDKPPLPPVVQPITITGYYDDNYGREPYSEPTCLTARDTAHPPIQRTCILTDTKVDDCAVGTTIQWSLADPTTYAYRYDPYDYAQDQADYMASNGIVAFVIGLGPSVTSSPNYQRIGLGSTADNYVSPLVARDPDAGERLLRYIADMGYDPGVEDDKKLWLCHSNWAWADPLAQPKLATSTSGAPVNCGNYWYAATGAGLRRVFEEIASRMFTRLQQ
jgi:hypothetical protein